MRFLKKCNLLYLFYINTAKYTLSVNIDDCSGRSVRRTFFVGNPAAEGLVFYHDKHVIRSQDIDPAKNGIHFDQHILIDDRIPDIQSGI